MFVYSLYSPVRLRNKQLGMNDLFHCEYNSILHTEADRCSEKTLDSRAPLAEDMNEPTPSSLLPCWRIRPTRGPDIELNIRLGYLQLIEPYLKDSAVGRVCTRR